MEVVRLVGVLHNDVEYRYMSEKRLPNTKCAMCEMPIYRRPFEIAKSPKLFCSRKCFNKHCGRGETKPPCPVCGKQYEREHNRRKFCSTTCSNQSRWGSSYSKSDSVGNRSLQKLRLLQRTFEFSSCMVEDCDYCTTYDIHRFVPGNQGGKYEIGNMFAICPNHHAEVSRKIIEFEKISDCVLKVK